MKVKDTARYLAEELSLPPEVPRLTLWGRQQLMVEQHRGLLGYSGELIEVGGGRQRLRILGSGLRLRAMDRQTLLIVGEIRAVEYE